ncbi:MAG: tetratricopeptide repeat protein [Muribaculaceae bacterium]|nr:tetratricopeptide repeat protein [Muribaculaceae bacterium]
MTHRNISHIIILLAMCGLFLVSCGNDAPEIPTVKKERKHIRRGNKDYNDKRYAEAEVSYIKALQEAPTSPIARYNLALALLRQGDMSNRNDGGDSLVNRATQLLEQVAKERVTPQLTSHACYALGNVAYSREDYAQAIEHYKNALRCDPLDDEARDNLRLAQLKQQQQQQNGGGGGGGNDQDQNKDQNQDQNKDQQQNDKNQDQNKDNEQNKDQNDKNQQDQSQNGDKDSQDGKQQQQQGGMSQQNMEQILQTMKQRENATQQRINAERAAEQKRERMRTNKKW